MFCSICTHPRQIAIVVHYIYSESYRQTAKRFGVGYRSLQRHVDLCLQSIFAEREEREYRAELEKWVEIVKEHFVWKQSQPKPRLKSIIKKEVRFTWSRKAWRKGVEKV